MKNGKGREIEVLLLPHDSTAILLFFVVQHDMLSVLKFLMHNACGSHLWTGNEAGMSTRHVGQVCTGR